MDMVNEGKLALMVDLDETLINTHLSTTIPVNDGMFKFTLSNNNTYTGFIRPGTEDFLNEMSSMYDMYVCTYADREYAEEVVKVLDPEGMLFTAV